METAAHRYTPTFLGAMLVSCKVDFPWSVDLPNLQGESDAREEKGLCENSLLLNTLMTQHVVATNSIAVPNR